MGGRFSLYKGSRKVLAKHKRRWVALPVAISVAAASPGLREAGSPAQSQTATTPDQAKRPATSETRPIPEAGSLAQPKSLDQVGLPAELARRAVLCDRQLDRVQQILGRAVEKFLSRLWSNDTKHYKILHVLPVVD